MGLSDPSDPSPEVEPTSILETPYIPPTAEDLPNWKADEIVCNYNGKHYNFNVNFSYLARESEGVRSIFESLPFPFLSAVCSKVNFETILSIIDPMPPEKVYENFSLFVEMLYITRVLECHNKLQEWDSSYWMKLGNKKEPHNNHENRARPEVYDLYLDLMKQYAEKAGQSIDDPEDEEEEDPKPEKEPEVKENEVVQEDDDSEVEEEKVLKEEIESEDCQRRGRKRASTCPKSGISPLNLLFGSLIPNTPGQVKVTFKRVTNDERATLDAVKNAINEDWYPLKPKNDVVETADEIVHDFKRVPMTHEMETQTDVISTVVGKQQTTTSTTTNKQKKKNNKKKNRK